MPVRRDYWPTIDWREAAPQELGMDPALLARMHAYIEEHLPGLHALLIVRGGYLVFEQLLSGLFSEELSQYKFGDEKRDLCARWCCLEPGTARSFGSADARLFPYLRS